MNCDWCTSFDTSKEVKKVREKQNHQEVEGMLMM